MAQIVRGALPDVRIVVCGDNDEPDRNGRRAGQEKAEEAAALVRGLVDELRRKTLSCLLPAVDGIRWIRVACQLRDGNDGHILLVAVPQSPKVHSILDDGTWTRMDASNRKMTAAEITELEACYNQPSLLVLSGVAHEHFG